MFIRFKENPLITPTEIKPVNENYKVIGVFNAAVAKFKSYTILILRVAEAPQAKKNEFKVPFFDVASQTTKIKSLDDSKYERKDVRAFIPKKGFDSLPTFLTSISYLRLAYSNDGIHFKILSEPFIYPHNSLQTYGIEDARCTKIGSIYYLNFSEVSPQGVSVGLVSTQNFKSYKDFGTIFLPDNKDVVIFPEKINGSYYALNRPSTANNNMWISKSPDLIHWGEHRLFLKSGNTYWDNGRVGAGGPPIKTDNGWLVIYHAADVNDRYCLGAMLLSLNDPTKIIGRTKIPFLEPKAPYELKGFLPNVVFTCGSFLEKDQITIYYGCADQSIAGGTISLTNILNNMKN
ncbi:hypothetical protein FD21_GL000364 [Liquorilactobacillus vini DSM 20605]|uniref:Glycosidase n=2 Tax=Liquorilactobacillus vini TaxID=238015 RepID=A0A0R2BV44_9LACO|nr:hypothetical protein FD21_GL000364 [Liquorilactobacillus vini DSM 20605]